MGRHRILNFEIERVPSDINSALVILKISTNAPLACILTKNSECRHSSKGLVTVNALKGDSLHFNLLIIVPFQIQGAGVQSQKDHCPNTVMQEEEEEHFLHWLGPAMSQSTGL